MFSTTVLYTLPHILIARDAKFNSYPQHQRLPSACQSSCSTIMVYSTSSTSRATRKCGILIICKNASTRHWRKAASSKCCSHGWYKSPGRVRSSKILLVLHTRHGSSRRIYLLGRDGSSSCLLIQRMSRADRGPTGPSGEGLHRGNVHLGGRGRH